MFGVVLNSRCFTRLLTSGEEDFDRVSVLKKDVLSTACELTMLILSISCIFNYEIVGQYILVHFTRLQGSALADLVYGKRFYGRLVIVNFCLQQ